MAEFKDPDEGATHVPAAEAVAAPRTGADPDADLATMAMPSGSPALVRLRQFIAANPIGAIGAAFAVGFLLARLFD